jgi:hypothetical protein
LKENCQPKFFRKVHVKLTQQTIAIDSWLQLKTSSQLSSKVMNHYCIQWFIEVALGRETLDSISCPFGWHLSKYV